MRYGLIGALVLCLGLAEYAYVQLAPLSSGQRRARIERLPVVKQVIERNVNDLANQVFERQGEIYHVRGKSDTTRWNSPQAFMSDYRNRERTALWQGYTLRNEAKIRKQIPEARQQARAGSPWGKLNYYMSSRYSWDEADRIEARELIMSDSTAIVEWYLSLIVGETRVSPWSAEGIVLSVRRIAEDLHHPKVSFEETHKHATSDSLALANYVGAAEDGHPEAVAALETLQTRYSINLADLLANWNGGHFEQPPTP